MSADFRALCAELASELCGYKIANPHHSRELLHRALDQLRPDPESDELNYHDDDPSLSAAERNPTLR
jgi:hypothetical protein